MNDGGAGTGPGIIVRNLHRIEDSRGWFLKILMRERLETGHQDFGEIYLTSAHPGQVKGNHFHRAATEWFCVVQGQGRLFAKDMATGGATDILMTADNPVVVEVPPNVAHAIQNVGQDSMVLLAYADQPYDADDPDEVACALVTPRS